MTSTTGELLSIAVGTLLAVIGLAVGSFDPLWEQLHVSTEIRSGLSIGLSLLFLLLGFLIALYLKAATGEAFVRMSLRELRSEIPQLSAFRVLDANAALTYLEGQLPLLRSIINTRIASGTNAGYSTAAGKAYSLALEKAIERGLQLREIVNTPWRESADSRQASLGRAKIQGSYEFQVLDATLPSFLNFCVLDYFDGRKELLFGWAITKGRRFEQRYFLSDEKSVVLFFEAWFGDLYAAARAP